MTFPNISHKNNQAINSQNDEHIIIPRRFSRIIDVHMLGNMLNLEHYPLILTIVGKPGMGKTFQLRNYLKKVGVQVFSISAADLESDRAGQPAKLLQQKYVLASTSIYNKTPAVLLIDDIDTTLGEWENHTGTVNHQNILAFLMHIADNPTYIESVGAVNRVPIFFTGNDFERLYKPLVRTGRAHRFDWEPTREEKIDIVASIFSLDDSRTAESIVDLYPDKELSYFTFVLSQIQTDNLAEIANTVSYSLLLSNPSYKQQLRDKYKSMENNIDWAKRILDLNDNVE